LPIAVVLYARLSSGSPAGVNGGSIDGFEKDFIVSENPGRGD